MGGFENSELMEIDCAVALQLQVYRVLIFARGNFCTASVKSSMHVKRDPKSCFFW